MGFLRVSKDEWLLWKYEWGLTRAIKHENIMPLLNDIIPKAFGQEEINKHAIADQGWNPLDQKLVEHPSISVDCNKDDIHAPLKILKRQGIGASVLDQIMREQAKNEVAKEVACKQ